MATTVRGSDDADSPTQVAAIDFGTTFSGYAFSTHSDFLDNPLDAHVSTWSRGAAVSLKTPSCVLFKPDQTFHSFGYEAEAYYADLVKQDDHYSWYLFRRFKMLLYDNTSLNRQTLLEGEREQRMPARVVFTAALRYLKEHLTETARTNDYGLIEKEVQWVLTVPAIWEDSAKQFMREAAFEAGIPDRQLLLALEPEAASLFCMYLPLYTEGRQCSLQLGTKYMVLDAGGGTVDITVHEKRANQKLKEVYKANGGPWGGTKVDKAFYNFLVNVVGEDAWEYFNRKHPDDYLDLVEEFELKKRTFKSDLHRAVSFNMPNSLCASYQIVNNQDFRNSLMQRQDLQNQFTFKSNRLRVKPDEVKRLLTETCNQITTHLQTVFQEPAVQGTNIILMVGGFSDCQILQEAVKVSFPDKTVVIPNEPDLAVLKGAVVYGHNPKAIECRVSKLTYGVKVYRSFDSLCHPESNKFTSGDGQVLCQGCFDKHVEIGQELTVGRNFSESTYHPRESTNAKTAAKIFASSNPNPMFVDDEGCFFIGQLDIDLSSTTGRPFSDRAVTVKFIYGGTELRVEARIKKTGEVLKANFNFLG